MKKETAYEFLVSTYSGRGVLEMLVKEFGLASILASLNEIAVQQSAQRTVCTCDPSTCPDDWRGICSACRLPRR